MSAQSLEILTALISPLISFLLGLVSVGIIWLIRTTNQSARDLNVAFQKIRDLEDEVYGDQGN